MFARLKEKMASRFLNGWRRATFDNEPIVEDVMPHEHPSLKTNTENPTRFGMFILLFGIGGFVLWAVLAPLDEGVPAPGVLISEGNRKAVQHLRGGIVQAIRVREGGQVRAGDVLVSLNDIEARAQLDIVLAQYWTAMAVEARLLAEQGQRARVTFPPDLLNQSDRRAKEAMEVQENLFNTRRDVLSSQVAILQENLGGLQEQINGLQSLQDSKQQQIQSINHELASLRGLAKEGFIPQVKLMEMERMVAELSGSRGDNIANIARARNAMAEVKLRMLQARQDFQKEVQQLLTEVQQDVANHRDRAKALQEDVERAQLRASVDGVVVGLSVFTVGGVIQPGQTIMEIVPQGETILVEARIPPHLIEKVQVGLEADIRIATVRGGLMPPVPGRLDTISADRLVDANTGMPYYLGRIRVMPEGLGALLKAKHPIQPGMAADIVIKTGERTLFDYLVAPLQIRVAGALKEI